ncbi:MAG: maltose alpha-D-glucosyltransferase, partial [Candidatus Eisenbacteria bacterium]|nr:maltose alpha-D-glucosyltransferase [Candidatus Eisenbacteria bacterium]
GLTQKLDYLQDLGVTAIWLLPFYPSPLRDDGYDIADYKAIHASYGTLRDFNAFMREAHARGLRVITELVINHTSDQHPWFQRARRAAPGSRYRDFYVWNDVPEGYNDARIIFKDFESSNWSWDPVARAYYWHRFYSHQPDLNFENRAVKRAVMRVLDFWLKRGVDGLRLDAVPYLYEREGTNCENLPETHAALRELRRHVDDNYENRMLLAEANQWPEEAVNYFGAGDECHMVFHFPLMPRLFMALRMENRYPIIDILDQTPAVPETSQWAIFLRNHDELTLEMVTDEERDYMYRMYAHDDKMRINLGIRRRLAPLMGNDRRRIELMNSLLFSLPGTPVIYYGDEIGMGDNYYLGDRDGVRTPMQWTPDRNAGFSEAMPQRLYLPVVSDPEYHYEAVNVSVQQSNPHSLLWWTKRLIYLRKRYPAFSRGELQFLFPENYKVLSFIRKYEDEDILVVANLSRFVQVVELDLNAYRGCRLVELFSGNPFPAVGEALYPLTLGPHAFYWFALEGEYQESVEVETAAGPKRQAVLTINRFWTEVVEGRGRAQLEKSLQGYLRERRWFGGKARKVRSVSITDICALTSGKDKENAPRHLLIDVEYTDGEPELYQLMVAFAAGDEAEGMIQDRPGAVVARLADRGGEDRGILYDALWNPDFCRFLLNSIGRRRRFKGRRGQVGFTPSQSFRRLGGLAEETAPPMVVGVEQSNTSVIYADRFILKFYRRLQEGENPDLEISRFLTDKAGFTHTPHLAGAVHYRRARNPSLTLGMLQSYVRNQGDAWTHTLDDLNRYFERIVAIRTEVRTEDLPQPGDSIKGAWDEDSLGRAKELIGPYLEDALLLGRRTAEMHAGLASPTEEPGFVGEPFTPFVQRSLYQSMRNSTRRTFQQMRIVKRKAVDETQRWIDAVIGREQEILSRFRPILDRKIEAVRIRCHGDYHLGQVLFTGKDFVIIDFEGEPARSLTERKLKRSPLQDAAGMLRSFHYAAHTGLVRLRESGIATEETHDEFEFWAGYWYDWVGAAFLEGYLSLARGRSFLPKDEQALEELLRAFLLEKAVYELGYELNNRPEWLWIPVQGVLKLLNDE